MTDKPASPKLIAPDLFVSDFEDVTPAARRAGIKYSVLLDPRIRSLLDRDVDPVEFEKNNQQEPLVTFVLVALRFLLDRFPTMTRFRYSVGSGADDSPRIPVLASFHQNDDGYFVALSLDIYGAGLNE